MKKIILSAVLACWGLGLGSAQALTLCDNYGKTWELTEGTEGTLVGTRDTLDLLGCNGMYTRGMYGNTFAGTHFVLTSMEGGDDTCSAVIWDGTWDGTSGSGTWYNQNGEGSGSFTLTSGACSTSTAMNSAEATMNTADIDPAIQ